MLRSDLVQRISLQNPHLCQRDVDKIIDAIFDEVIAAMARGDRVEVRGFGAFSAKLRKARTGRNPRRGIPIPVKSKVAPYFKAGKEMKELVNRREE